MLANPWILLGSLLLWLASLTGVYFKATHDQQARDEATAALKLQQKLQSAENDWAVNYQAALELEQEKQANERKHQTHSRAVATAVAADPHAKDCSLAPDSLGVLISSVRAANGSEAAASGVSDGGLQPGDGAPGRDSAGAGLRPGQHGVDALYVPPGVQGTAQLGQ